MSIPNLPSSLLNAQPLTPIAVQTGSYTAGSNQLVPVDATNGAVTITLPTAPADKSRITVKKLDASTNIVTIATGGSDIFNKVGGSTTVTLIVQNQSTTIQYTASSSIWYVVASDTPLTSLDSRYTTPTDVAAAISTQATTDAGQYLTQSAAASTYSTGEADYIVSISGSTITATPRNTAKPVYTGTDASVVLNSAIAQLTPSGGSGTGGGHIKIRDGVYYLNGEVDITGWESSYNGNTYSQLIIEGDGYATQLVQNTVGNNGIVVKDSASFVLRDLRIFSGASAMSCLLLDNSGAHTEISCAKSSISNVDFQSSSTSSPAAYLKNFFSLSVVSAQFTSGANHGLILENNSSSGVDYGNSHFGRIQTQGASSGTYAGLAIQSTGATGTMNLLSFGQFQCVGSSYYGLYTKGFSHSTFEHVDIEGHQYPIYFDGTSTIATSSIRVKSGYLYPTTSGTGITNTLYTGANSIEAYIQTASTTIPISDLSNSRPANSYNVTLFNASSSSLISILNAATTPLTVHNIGGTVSQNLPSGVTTTTPTSGDSSTKVATTAFVASAVTGSIAPTTVTATGTVTVPANAGHAKITAVGGGGGGGGAGSAAAYERYVNAGWRYGCRRWTVCRTAGLTL